MDKITKLFVIQEHTTPDGVHWDLMLQAEQVLWTWRIRTPPEQIFREAVPAERIADHPLRFLTYEGPVQKNTGQVKIADSGQLSLLEQSEDFLVFDLCGTALSGRFELARKEQTGWTLRQIPPAEDSHR